MKKCKYCMGDDTAFVNVNDTVEFSCIEMAINRQGMFRVRTYGNGYEPSALHTEQDTIIFGYCPFCGRKFTQK